MKPFTIHRGRVAPLDRVNVDTDQIIPKQFLKRIEKTGFGQYVFYDWRFGADGKKNPDFVLHDPRYEGTSILVAGKNFGCGSSREHAVYALWDWGFRAAIAPSFGDIFYGNSLKNGFLPIVLSAEVVAGLLTQLRARPGAHVVVDLARQEVLGPDGKPHRFEIDAFRRDCLLQGVDELDFTLGFHGEIEGFEKRHSAEMSWL